MSSIAAVMLAALAAALSVRVPHARIRLRRLRVQARSQPPGSKPGRQAVWLVAAAAALTVGALLGPWVGGVAGALAALVGRRRPDPPSGLDVPLLADLLAACLSAGASSGDALRAAANASPEAAAACRPVADRLAAGLAPREAWSSWLSRPELAPIARACVRAADSGAATTQELRRAGDRARARRRAELSQRAHRAAVWAVLPLGVCFLPAFVLVGIVPFALGLLGR